MKDNSYELHIAGNSSQETARICLLPLTFDLMTSHIFSTSDNRKKTPINMYCWSCIEGKPNPTTLHDLYEDELTPEWVRKSITDVLLNDFRVKWGRYGYLDDQFEKDLSEFILKERVQIWKDPANKKRSYSGAGLNFIFKCFRIGRDRKDYFQPMITKSLKPSHRREFVRDFLSDRQDLVLVPTDKEAMKLGRITKLFIDLAAMGTPEKAKVKRKGLADIVSKSSVIHPDVFSAMKNVYLFSDIGMPVQLLSQLQGLFDEKLQNIIPFSLLYQVANGKAAGSEYLSTMTDISLMLGYHNSATASFLSQEVSKKSLLGLRLAENFPFYLDGIVAEQELSPRLPHHAILENQPLDMGYKIIGDEHTNRWRTMMDGECLRGGIFTGYYIIDRSRIPGQKKTLSLADRHRLFHLDRASYTPQENSIFTCNYLDLANIEEWDGYSHSMFLSKSSQIEAFTELVSENKVTKPSAKIIGKGREDQRWRSPYYDKYKVANYDVDLLTDTIFESIKAKKKSRRDRFTKELVAHAVLILKGMCPPQEYGFAPVKIREQKIGKKLRLIADASERQKDVERVLLDLVNCALMFVSKNDLDYRFTNSLHGTSPSLHTGGRWSRVTKEHGGNVIFANIDVTSCFESMDLLSDNFEKAMTRSRNALIDRGYGDEAKILWTILNDYFVENIRRKSFSMEIEEGCDRYHAGMLPTGFVLSSGLLYFLSLPMAFQFTDFVKEGILIEWEQCTDDFTFAAPADISDEVREKILAPVSAFGRDLGLKFHCWKKYLKDEVVELTDDQKNSMFERDDSAPLWKRAWSKITWPANIPIQHGGITIRDGQVSVVARIRKAAKDESNVAKVKLGRRMHLGFHLSNYRREGKARAWAPLLMLRAWQHPEMKTGEVARLMGEKAWSHDELPEPIQTQMLFSGERAFIGRMTQDDKGKYQIPKMTKTIGMDDFKAQKFSHPSFFREGQEIQSIPTGRFFLLSDSRSIVVDYEEEEEAIVEAISTPPLREESTKPSNKKKHFLRVGNYGVEVEEIPKHLTDKAFKGSAIGDHAEEYRTVFCYHIPFVDTLWEKERTKKATNNTWIGSYFWILPDADGGRTKYYFFNEHDIIERIKEQKEAENKRKSDENFKRYQENVERRRLEASKFYLEKYDEHLQARRYKQAGSALKKWFLNQRPFFDNPDLEQIFKNIEVRPTMNLQEELLLYRRNIAQFYPDVPVAEISYETAKKFWDFRDILDELSLLDRSRVYQRVRFACEMVLGERGFVPPPETSTFKVKNYYAWNKHNEKTKHRVICQSYMGKAIVEVHRKPIAAEALAPAIALAPIVKLFIERNGVLSPQAQRMVDALVAGDFLIPTVRAMRKDPFYKVGGMQPFDYGYFRHKWPGELLRGWGCQHFSEREYTEFSERDLPFVEERLLKALEVACEKQMQILDRKHIRLVASDFIEIIEQEIADLQVVLRSKKSGNSQLKYIGA